VSNEVETLTSIIEPAGPQDHDAIIAKIVLNGDLSSLGPRQKVQYYNQFCEALGLNPLTRPFEYISMKGKLVLYATKACTEQLRKTNGVSVTSSKRDKIEDVLLITVNVKDKTGRTDLATGALDIDGLKGDDLANAIMKAETKAKRRATLSICGLGVVDETELETTTEAVMIDPEDCQEKKRAILQLIDDSRGLISEDYITEIATEIDFAVSENDASGLDVIMTELRHELKKDTLKEVKVNMDDTFDGMKKASELDTAESEKKDGEQLEIF